MEGAAAAPFIRAPREGYTPLRISRSKLEPGMEVSADVVDAGGRLLVPKGTKLTLKHIRAFEPWNIPSAQIATPDSHGSGGEKALSKDEENAIRARFRHNDVATPFMSALLEEILGRARRRR